MGYFIHERVTISIPVFNLCVLSVLCYSDDQNLMLFKLGYWMHVDITLMAGDSVSNFGRAFIDYGSYHYDPVNKWIHIIFVPIIACTLFSWLSYIPYSVDVGSIHYGAAELIATFVLAYYLTIKLSLAFGMGVLALALHLGWKAAFAGLDDSNLFWWVLGLHIFSWAVQFVGHGVFEKRKPALIDNFVQIFNAPLFIVVEIYEMLGFQSEDMKQWHAQIKKNVEVYRASKDKQK